jgi:hypothetical protein
MGFARNPLVEEHSFTERDLNVDLGMRFDYGGALKLNAGESFSLPAVAFTSSDAGLDEAAIQSKCILPLVTMQPIRCIVTSGSMHLL